ncbi:MAG: DUF362 domain-containing protein [Clostridia bacterium]|nr:DUF362 domain-containing protein [Clostridia bacterium]
MSNVLLIRQTDYEPSGIESAVCQAFDFFGGVNHFVAPGDKVLLKVNLVAGHKPERRVTTDPSVVEAAACLVLDCGGHPVIADSPGIDSFTRAAEKAGLMDVARRLGIPCVELDDPVALPPGESFRKIEVGRLVREADAVINLPKMKTHGQMRLTLGVKNLFGCVVGRSKAAWHYNVGLNRERFASLLLDIYKGVAPAFTLLDGVIGMDGDGPTGGRPFPYGVIAAAEDALTLDFWLCRMLGVPLEDFPLWRAARQRGLPQCELKDGAIAGDLAPAHRFSGAQVPASHSLRLIPRFPFVGPLIEKAMTSRPVHIPERCIGCGRCQEVCAAGALKHSGQARAVSGSISSLSFDYSKCIRCYCCHEMCPVQAIGFMESPLVRLGKIIGI